MCGRAYSTYTDEEIAFRYMNQKPFWIPHIKPNYNVSPSHQVLILRKEHKQSLLEFFRWGLIPFWAKNEKIGYKMINARADTIAEKPSFRQAFIKRRCIVPLSGFIEWKRDDKAKRPFCIHLKDSPIMSVAGIWESWQSPEGIEIGSVSLITTKANSFMEKIHDRMPVIVNVDDEETWLDPELQDKAVLQKLLKPCRSQLLAAFEVSTLINSPKNNSPDVLKALG